VSSGYLSKDKLGEKALSLPPFSSTPGRDAALDTDDSQRELHEMGTLQIITASTKNTGSHLSHQEVGLEDQDKRVEALDILDHDTVNANTQ
jgi:hypothetical protein